MRAVSAGSSPFTRSAKSFLKALTPDRLHGDPIMAVRRRVLYSGPPPEDEEFMAQLRRRFKHEVVALSEHLGATWSTCGAMGTSTEPLPSADGGDGPFGSSWRAGRERAQEACMPRGETVISCLAPFGAGGLGRHLQEVARALQRTGRDPICLCGPCEDPSALPERCQGRCRTAA